MADIPLTLARDECCLITAAALDAVGKAACAVQGPRFRVPLAVLLPADLARYLCDVIGANRAADAHFHFDACPAQPPGPRDLAALLARQFAALRLAGVPCFRSVMLAGEALCFTASAPFLDACRTAGARFVIRS